MKHIRFIPFGNVTVGPIAREYIAGALDNQWVSQRENVAEFERLCREIFQKKHAIATSSGTDAGIVAMAAAREVRHKNYDDRDEVATPACAYVATATCILAAGFFPLFTDIKLDTLNMDYDAVRQHEQCGINIVQFVHTMGKPCEGFRNSPPNGQEIISISDACEAHLASLDGREVQHGPDMTILSFYVAHIAVAGEGGVILTDDDKLADICRSVRVHGRKGGVEYFNFERIGWNSKMNDLCAAVGIESLQNIRTTFEQRRRVRAWMIEALSKYEDDLILYRDGSGEVISPHAFPVVLRNPRANVKPFMEHLAANGVEVKTLFGSLPTQHKAFAWMGHKLGEFPVAERVGRTGCHWGCNENIDEGDVEYLASVVEAYFAKEAA